MQLTSLLLLLLLLLQVLMKGGKLQVWGAQAFAMEGITRSYVL